MTSARRKEKDCDGRVKGPRKDRSGLRDPPTPRSLIKSSQGPEPDSAPLRAQQTKAAILLPKVISSSTLSMRVELIRTGDYLESIHWPCPPSFLSEPCSLLWDPVTAKPQTLASLHLLNHPLPTYFKRPSFDKRSN